MGAGNSLKVASSMSLAKELPNPLQGTCPLAINNNNASAPSRCNGVIGNKNPFLKETVKVRAVNKRTISIGAKLLALLISL